MSPSLERQYGTVVQTTVKSAVLGPEGLISCVALGKLLNFIKFQYPPLKSSKNTYLLNVTVKIKQGKLFSTVQSKKLLDFTVEFGDNKMFILELRQYGVIQFKCLQDENIFFMQINISSLIIVDTLVY